MRKTNAKAPARKQRREKEKARETNRLRGATRLLLRQPSKTKLTHPK